MGTLVMIGGEIRSPDTATISVFDRGFLYGDSVFETIRTYGGELFALTEHLERLESSADKVFISVPIPIARLADEVRHLLAEAANDESYVRVVITRGGGAMGLDPNLAESPERVIIVSPLVAPPAAYYQDGITAVTFKSQRPAEVAGVGGAKLGNYLLSVLAMKQAKEAGALEALIVDGNGSVVEGASSNVFGVRDGRLITPELRTGILRGITRQRVLEQCEILGLPVEMRAPSLDELRTCDEIFITSSIREMLAIVTLDGARVGSGKPGPVYRRLLAAFRASLQS